MKHSDINRLIEIHGKKVYNFCMRLCASTYDAEDLYQDTFLKAMEKITVIDENNNPSAYLCTIAVSLYKSKVRKSARRQAIAPTVPIEERLTQASDDVPEETFLRKELAEEIKEAVSALDEKLRLCVIMHYVGAMSLGDIAQELNLPEGTVKSRLHTARNILKEKFAKGAQV